MFGWFYRWMTRSPVDHARRLRVLRDDPQALGDKPDHVPARKPGS